MSKPGMTAEEVQWFAQYQERMDAVEAMLAETEAEAAAGHLTPEEAEALMAPLKVNVRHMMARLQLIMDRLDRS